MQDFSRRSTQPELMDTEKVDYNDFAKCLDHLSLINTCTLAYRPTLKWVKSYASDKKLNIVDVGSGGGDMMRKIWHMAKKHKFSVNIIGADMNDHAKIYADQKLLAKQSSLNNVTKNAFDLSNVKKSDLIISSLFTHHLIDEELISFIVDMDENAGQGWFINDLHRHPIAYYFIKAITYVFPFHRFVKHDAAVSVARAFTKKDWINILKSAGINESRYKVEWYFPFRYCVSCQK